MTDWYLVLAKALELVGLRPADRFMHVCEVSSSAELMELDDAESIIAEPGTGVGVISNPEKHNLYLLHIGNAILKGARKQNALPSACDIAVTSADSSEMVLCELTRSNPRSIEGVETKPGSGKRLKALNQLLKTIGYIEAAGFESTPDRKTAIFFFRLPDCQADPAARMLQALYAGPALSQVTTAVIPEYPDWTFLSHPYPHPYIIS